MKRGSESRKEAVRPMLPTLKMFQHGVRLL